MRDTKQYLRLWDIKFLVDTFYGKVVEDALLGPIFDKHTGSRWSEHLPRMYRFWQTVLVGERTYSGSPFPPHTQLPIDGSYLTHWLNLFCKTVDEHFRGEKAEDAKWRARKMTQWFSCNMKQSNMHSTNGHNTKGLLPSEIRIKSNNMKTTVTQTIGEMVAKDYRLAEIFTKYKIDFCCKGNRSIDEACKKKGVHATELLREIETLSKIGTVDDGNSDFKSWPLDLLTDYIEKKHHRYVESKTPTIWQYLVKIAAVHGAAVPSLIEVRDLFGASSKDLAAHMKKEELILFPYIRKMVKGAVEAKTVEPPHFGTVKNPIAMMMAEHQAEGDRFTRIAELTHDFTPPTNACSTYKAAMAMLADFEKDLHKHIHLENNILFPKAVEMEVRGAAALAL